MTIVYKPIKSEFYIDKGYTVICCTGSTGGFQVETGTESVEKPV